MMNILTCPRLRCYIVAMFSQRIWLILIGICAELLWVGIRSLGPLRENTAAFLLLIFCAFILLLCVLFFIQIGKNKSVWLVLGFAILFRLTVLPAPPDQSEDVYRYIWDARVASMGISPYAYPPNAPELEKVRDTRVYPWINSKPYVTAYPPISQVLFRISFRSFGESVVAIKGVFCLLEILAMLVAWRLMVLWGTNIQTILLVAWNPFFIFEFSYSGHSDSAMMFLALLSVYLLARARKSWAAVSYAGAVLAKLHPALWFPLFLRRTGWKPMTAGVAAGLGLIFIYFNAHSGMHYLKSLSLYFRLFEFNASIHYLIRFIGRWTMDASWDKLIGPYLGVALLGIAISIYWKFPAHDSRGLLHAAFWLMTADLCLATTAHPWYICWAAFALPFFPYAFMIYWTGACFLSYAAYSFHPVHEPAWALLIEYLPVYGLMAWEIYRRGPVTWEWIRGGES
jgi:hypothetical protein